MSNLNKYIIFPKVINNNLLEKIKPFENFKYSGVYISGYYNEKNLIKKEIIAPLKSLYIDKTHYIEQVYNYKTGEYLNPNGIQINTIDYNIIDIDNPKKCIILDKLLKDCLFKVKTYKGYHFYFEKNNELPINVKIPEFVDINLPTLFFVPEYSIKDTPIKCSYKIIENYNDKPLEIVKMPQYVIDWCKTVIECHNITKKIKEKKIRETTEEIITDTNIYIEKFDLKIVKSILEIFYENGYLDTFDNWKKVGYMVKHLNNSYECFKLFDKYCKMVENYKTDPNNNNRKLFYNPNYNINFDENAVLLKCQYLDPKKFKMTLQYIFKSKYEDIIEHFHKPFIFDENDIKIFEDWFNLYKILGIKSPYGTGKTYCFKQLIKIYNPKKILFITYRQSLAHSFSLDLKNDFNFVNYLDEDIDLKNAERVIIQLDSLNKLINKVDFLTQNDGTPYYDLVILDEIEGLLNHLSFNKINQFKIHNILIKILNKSNKILALDGDLNDRSYDFLTTIKKDISFKFYTNDFKGISKNFIFSQNIAYFDNLINIDINNNKKIVIVCMTKTESDKYYDLYKDKKKVILHNSFEKNKEILRDVNNNWSKCDILIYSPSVESGVDFNIKNYFYKCYATLSNSSTSYRAFFQMLNRVRFFENNDINCLLSNNLTTEINNILVRFDEMRLTKWRDIELNNLTTVLIHNDVERYNSNKYFICCIVNTLKNKGHTYSFLKDKPKEKEKLEQTEKIKLLIINAEDITEDEYINFKYKRQNNEDLTRDENFKMTKYIYKSIFKTENIDMEFMNLHYNKFHIVKNYNLLINDNKKPLEKTEYLNQFNYKKCDKIKELIHIMGYDVINKKLVKTIDLNYSKIKNELLDFLNTKNTKFIFDNNRDIKNNNIMMILNEYINNYGLTLKNKTFRKRDGEKLTTDYKINVELLDIIKSLNDKSNIDEIDFIDY